MEQDRRTTQPICTRVLITSLCVCTLILYNYLSFQTRIDDGDWHKVKVLRRRRTAILQVDNNKPARVKAPKGATVLNTDGKVWIGEK